LPHQRAVERRDVRDQGEAPSSPVRAWLIQGLTRAVAVKFRGG